MIPYDPAGRDAYVMRRVYPMLLIRSMHHKVSIISAV